ncbi:hypothetical protein ABZW32_19060 [Streptomyces sp. NPDC004667]|uniref:BP74-related protein n=1 Tax=Streptomyces sp. NPDC004667 TaxID=3154285 RepID=UPI0033B6E1C8
MPKLVKNSVLLSVTAAFVVGASGVAVAAGSASGDDRSEALVTFAHYPSGEEFRVKVTDAGVIDHAEQLMAGAKGISALPVGIIERAPTDNADNPGYDWRVKSESFEFADAGSLTCDGAPSGVTNGPMWYYDTVSYCPWIADVVKVDKR